MPSFCLIVIALVTALLCACERKPALQAGNPAAGHQLFESGCAVCHAAGPQKKVGPGLAGLYKMEALPNGAPVTDQNVESWIRNGGGLMPPFKNALSPEQMRDLIAYLKTL